MQKDIIYVGVKDEKIRLFEGQFYVPEGMLYNSYVIVDEKIAVMDSVEAGFANEWIDNVKKVLGDKTPDYLVISHMEPDHSGSIVKFVERYPTATIVGNDKTFSMMTAFYGEINANKLVVKNGETLVLGKHSLLFTFAPMVHWPEVMVSYDAYAKTLFSADAFGKFGTDLTTNDWACEARRYYFGIIGKFGAQVQGLIKKLAAFEIDTVCPLHGPVLEGDLTYYLGLYDVWSQYRAESRGVAIVYVSVYGNTEKAALLLKDELEAAGVETEAFDLNDCDFAEAIEGAFEFDRLVVAATTYNGDVFPKMREFLAALVERNYRNRVVGMIENGSWAPQAGKVMTALLESCKELTFINSRCTLRSGLKDENKEEIKAMAKELESF
ncbi:MAG: FprA family A-type flavoprotein [Clostridia bacterium]|nr:FprA family A-type flavoprotein [Clostridia bacterium]